MHRDKDFFLLHEAFGGERICWRRSRNSLPDTAAGLLQRIMSPAADIQVLTPVRKGLLGSINLNRELQDVLNPPCAAAGGKDRSATGPSAKATRSCRSKNNYQMAWKNLEDFTEGEGVFNGDVGVHSQGRPGIQ